MEDYSADPFESLRGITSMGAAVFPRFSFLTAASGSGDSSSSSNFVVDGGFGRFVSPPMFFAVGGVSTVLAALHLRRRNMVRVHNCSLNIILPLPQRGGYSEKKKRYIFKFRTLFERPLVDVVGGNNVAALLVAREGSRKNRLNNVWYNRWVKLVYGTEGEHETREKMCPVIDLTRGGDVHKSIMKSICNQVSSVYTAGFVAEAMGLPVVTERFVVALTCEDSSRTFFYKTRTMVTKESVLLAMAKDPEEFRADAVQLESRKFSVRLATVKQLALEYKANPWKFEVITLCIPTSSSSTMPTSVSGDETFGDESVSAAQTSYNGGIWN